MKSDTNRPNWRGMTPWPCTSHEWNSQMLQDLWSLKIRDACWKLQGAALMAQKMQVNSAELWRGLVSGRVIEYFQRDTGNSTLCKGSWTRKDLSIWKSHLQKPTIHCGAIKYLKLQCLKLLVPVENWAPLLNLHHSLELPYWFELPHRFNKW